MSAVDGGDEPQYQLAEARSTLTDLRQRVGAARERETEALREKIRSSAKAGDSLADCQEYVHMATAYATVAQDLVDLGFVHEAEVVLGLGMDWVTIAQDCLDHVA